MKTRLLILLWCSLAIPGLAQQSATQLLSHYRQTLPLEKLYLHTDQSVYEPGDIIWFSAYLVNDQNQRIADWIQVQLLDPQGQLVRTVNFSANPNGPNGAIQMDKSLSGGVYTLRATSQWLLNFGQDALFEKKLLVQKTVLPRLRLKLELDRNKYQAAERVIAQVEVLNNDNQALSNLELQATPMLGNTNLPVIAVRTNVAGKATFSFQLPNQIPATDGLLQVKLMYEGQSESIARSIPLRQERIKLWLFPEGGDLVADFNQKVAFKMLDTLGNSVDGRGTLYDSRHQPLARFESFHKGMGTFNFTPRATEHYYVCVEGQKDTFSLPEVREDELALRVEVADKDSLPLVVWKRNAGSAHLLLRCKDSMVWEQKLPLTAGITALKIPIRSLPIGIAQVILLDEQSRPFAERLVFLNQHRQVYLQVKTDQDAYLPLGKVKIDIEAKDETGKPLDGVFSLAVVDDLHWTAADDKQDNILSRLLLSAELRGKIDEPAFYFKPDEPKVPIALDLLMLTHGWRKFTWKEVLAFSPQKTSSFLPFPRSTGIKGQLLDHRNYGKQWHRKYKKYARGRIWIDGQSDKIKTDSLGHFSINLPKDASQYPLTLIATNKGIKTTYPLLYPLVPTFRWPDPLKTGLKSINIDKIAEPNLKEKVSLVKQPAQSLLAGEEDIASYALTVRGSRNSMLNEVVVVGFGIDYAAQATSAIVNRNSGAGIGDNLVSNSGDFERLQNLWIQLEGVYNNVYKDNFGSNLQARIFANFSTLPTTDQQQRSKTIYWTSQVTIKQGKGSLEFQHTHKTGTFRIVMEGVSQQALIGRTEVNYAVQKKLELNTQVPEIVLAGDTMILEIRLKNRGEANLSGHLQVTPIAALECLNKDLLEQKINIPPYTTQLIRIPYLVKRIVGKSFVQLQWDDGENSESWSQPFAVQLQEFRHELAHAGGDAQTVFQFPLSSFIPGSLLAHFHAYSSLYQEMVEGLEAIIREPHGCFEQVSSSNYPSIMALQVLQETGGVDFDFQKRAIAHLEKGYKLLTGYAVPGGGFSVFGQAPAIERITAYGLLQFWDMRKVFSGVDMNMFEKNLNWLLDRKKALSADPLSHLFTLYALSEIRPSLLQDDLPEFEKKEQKNLGKDPYLLAMLLSAYANAKDSSNVTRLQEQLKELLEAQKPGSFLVNSTFGLSYGKNVQTETAAWAILALCKAGQSRDIQVKHLLDFLRRSRDSYGGFGSTQATVVALKALQAFQQSLGNVQAPGEIRVRVNGTWLDTLYYTPQQMEKLKLECSQWLKTGLNEIEIVQTSSQKPIPFVFEAQWANTEIPQTSPVNPLDLQIRYSNARVNSGDFVRLSVNVKNQLSRTVNAPMLVLGIPAGLSLQSWQLLEMEKKHLFDHFELRDNYLVLYFESMDSQSERSFYFDLKASQAGYYQSPLSVAYPYYDAEQKNWTRAVPMHIYPASN